MTEIPVFPGGAPAEVPPPGDWHGLFTGLHVSLNRIATRLPDPRALRREKSGHVWSVRVDPIPVALSGGTGVLDVPQMLGPRLGEYWDVHSCSATGFTAGTVSGWVNMPAGSTATPQGALRVSFPSAGLNNFGKNQLHLRPNDRLVFVATSITGVVLVSLDATRVAEEYWAEYLL